jgi:hypothetical protein
MEMGGAEIEEDRWLGVCVLVTTRCGRPVSYTVCTLIVSDWSQYEAMRENDASR